MNFSFDQKLDIDNLIAPETPIESMLIALPEFQTGYNWGIPRFGHPEGKVGLHVREVLDNVDKLEIDVVSRRLLRLITIVHDTFKYKEDRDPNRDKSKHHGMLARRFIEPLIDNNTILDIVELHDEAFYVWRGIEIEKKPEAAMHRFDNLLQRLGGNLPLFYLFFKCDTQTGDKIQAPLRWFERSMQDLGVAL